VPAICLGIRVVDLSIRFCLIEEKTAGSHISSGKLPSDAENCDISAE
jgi:hypothetical protein